MSSIKDINGSISSGYVPVNRVGFDVPMIVGVTGQRYVLKTGSGVNGLVVKSVSRDTGFNIQIIVTGSSYVYNKVGSDITITVPTTHTIRALIADFAVSGGALSPFISLEALTTGAGSLTAIASTAMSALGVYTNIQDISQLKYYYDETDPEYVMINNMLGGQDTHVNNIYLLDVYSTLDVYGVPTSTTRDRIQLYDTGDWYFALVSSTAVTVIDGVNQYISTVKRLMGATTSDVADLATVQGNIVYVVHPSANKDDHPEASWVAKALVPVPGSSLWKFVKNLQGQTANTTSDLTALLAVRTAQGNSYTTQGGQSFMNDGLVNNIGASSTSPDYIDAHILKDWIVLNSEADISSLFLSKVSQGSKVDYDDKGINEIFSTVMNRLLTAAKNGAIARVSPGNNTQAALSYDGVYRYGGTKPTRASIEATSPDDIVQRILNNLTFWYIPSGGIEKVTFTGLELITEIATA